MSSMPDWSVWALGLGVAALFVWFFWATGAAMLRYGRRLLIIIEEWPQTRRAMAEAEAQAGGRFPLWLRALRVVLVLAMLALVALLVWRRVLS